MDVTQSKVPAKVQQVFRCKYCGRNYMKAEELIAHKKENHMAEIIAARKRESVTATAVSTGYSKNNTKTIQPASNEVVRETNGIKNSESRVSKFLVKEYAAENDDDERSDDNSAASIIRTAHTSPIAIPMDRTNVTLFPTPSPSYLKASSDGFQCPVCSGTFNYDYQLMQHMTSHTHDQKSSDPPYAAIPSFPAPAVITHDVPPERIRIQKPSKRRTPRSRPLLNSVRRYRCQQCFKNFPRHSKLLVHIKEVHEEQASHPARIPPRPPARLVENTTISTPLPTIAPPRRTLIGGRIRHSYPRLNTKSFKCKKCNFSCRFNSSLTRHQSIHAGPQLYTCEFCEGSFKSISSKLLHLSISHPAEAKFGRRKSKVPYNEQLKHSESDDPNVHDCEDCGAPFPTSSALQHHWKFTHGKLARRCDYCPYVSSSGNVKVHVARLHQNRHSTKHQCEFCGATCHSGGSLQNHIRMVHHKTKKMKRKLSAIPRAQSSVAGNPAVTFTETEPNKIQNQDTYARKFIKCSECPYKAYNIGDVNRHMKNIHTVQRQYQCEFCSASYEALRHFETHQLLHTQEESGKSKQTPSKTKSPRRVGWKNTRKPSVEEGMPVLEPMVDTEPRDDGHDAEDSWNPKTTDARRCRRCRICEMTFGSNADFRRHCLSQLHIYNEQLRQMQRRGEEGRPIGLGYIRHRSECDHCGMLFQVRTKLLAHVRKKHRGGVGSDKEQISRGPRASLPRVSPSSRLTTHAEKSVRVPENIDHHGSHSANQGGDDSFYSVADFPKSDEEETEQKQSNEIEGETNRTVTVTQQKNFGLKITTVRYGS